MRRSRELTSCSNDLSLSSSSIKHALPISKLHISAGTPIQAAWHLLSENHSPLLLFHACTDDFRNGHLRCIPEVDLLDVLSDLRLLKTG